MFQDARFQRWVQSLKQLGRLDAHTEQRLAEKWRATRDPAAARAILETHLLFVVKIARGLARRGVPIADLVAEGNLGLFDALEHFDPSRNTRFVTYAVWWIRARMFAHFRRRGSTLRDVSLDAPASASGSATWLHLLTDPSEAQDQRASRHERERIVRERLGLIEHELSARERYIVAHRLLADEGETLAAIGRRFGISRERARQIEEQVKLKLRDGLAELAPERRAA